MLVSGRLDFFFLFNIMKRNSPVFSEKKNMRKFYSRGLFFYHQHDLNRFQALFMDLLG